MKPLASLSETNPVDLECAAALSAAARSDPSPAVPKKASWYAPGGVVYQRSLMKARGRRPA